MQSTPCLFDERGLVVLKDLVDTDEWNEHNYLMAYQPPENRRTVRLPRPWPGFEDVRSSHERLARATRTPYSLAGPPEERPCVRTVTSGPAPAEGDHAVSGNDGSRHTLGLLSGAQ
jgi:hypothetical protein